MKKILCVGIGGYAKVYLSALLSVEAPDFEIVGMVDIAPERSEHYKELCDMGVPLYNKIEDFYKEHSADLAIITTPIHLHKFQILCALKNGSDVMCEKPLSGVSEDEKEIEQLSREVGKFVIIGFQWSYSEAINSLKEDIINGVLGKPEFLKTIVLWPRPQSYFTRGSGWAGKIKSSDGTVINDSVANNATAHYLHNMLYVSGKCKGESAEVLDVSCDLARINNIENFDTVTAKMTLDNGTKCLYIASHATSGALDPVFEYRFENAKVIYSGDSKNIIAYFKDGSVKNYGDPFRNVNEKIFEAINQAGNKEYSPCCGVKAAAAQVRCVEQFQKEQISSIKSEFVEEKNDVLYAKGLYELLIKCYNEEKIISEYPQYFEMIDQES